MKYLPICILAFTALFFAGCSKKDSGNGINYTVNGLSDMSVRQYQDTTISVAYNILLESGAQEAVTITPENLPAGVTVSPTSVSGTPTFAAMLAFRIHILSAGTYPVSIKASSASSGSKTYTFNIQVAATDPYVYSVAGLHDVTLEYGITSGLYLPFAVNYTSGPKETVFINATCSSGAITLSPASTSGLPNFSDSFAISTPFNTPMGTYPVTVTDSTSQGVHTQTFNVHVQSDCAPTISGGTWNGTVDCGGTPSAIGGNVVEKSISRVSMPSPVNGMIADLNCSAGTLMTEAYTKAGINYSAGSGTFSAHHIVISYSMSGSSTGSCTLTLDR